MTTEKPKKPAHSRKQPYPRSTKVEVWTCGHCAWPHLLLFDEDGRVIAEAIMPDQSVEAMYHFVPAKDGIAKRLV